MQKHNDTSSHVMNETQSPGCLFHVTQPATTTAPHRFQLFHPQSTFPGTSTQQASASLSTTTLPVWSYAPPRTQTLGGSNSQGFASTSSSTSTSSNSAFTFSAPQPPSSLGSSPRHVIHAARRLSRERQETCQISPSTAASSMFSFSPAPSVTVPKRFCFNSVTTPTSNIFSNVKNFTVPDTKAFKFNSYSEEENKKKFNFNWSLPSSSQAVNKNVFGFRGSFLEAINSSGQSSLHLGNRQPPKFIPTLARDIYSDTYEKFQCITVMPQYSSMSFEEIRFEYYKAQRKIFVFGSSPFVSNTPYFFSGGNKESKQVIHQEAQTSCDTDRQPASPKRLFNELWKVLECAVCMDLVRPPIMLCQSGHHLCSQCWSKVQVCPMCKRKKTDARNYALETVCETVPLPCKYYCEGCEVMLVAGEKEKHEETCDFRPFRCPIDSCMKAVDPKNMMLHCVTMHGIRIAVECPLDSRPYVWNSPNVELTKYICAFNLLQWGMFLLCHKEVEQTSCVWLQQFHVNSKDDTFFYEIKVSDKKTMQSVIYRGPVTNLSFNAEEVKHKCLRISSALVSTTEGASYEMKLEIWKNRFALP